MDWILANYTFLWMVVIATFFGGIVLWIVGAALQRHGEARLAEIEREAAMSEPEDRLY
jgi:hypothetical protein